MESYTLLTVLEKFFQMSITGYCIKVLFVLPSDLEPIQSFLKRMLRCQMKDHG